MRDFDAERRGFLKASVVAGVSVYLAPFGSAAFAALFEERLLTPLAWNGADGSAKFRIDGLAKATGAKIFARDIRARDMPHWPQQQAHAFVLRTTKADRAYQGFDLSALGDELKPDRAVTAEDLARDGLAFPKFYGDDMLLPRGKTPAYLGHAVAILIYRDFARFRFAKSKLRLREDTIRYGEITGPIARDPWSTFRFVRVGGETPYADDIYSSLKDMPIFPAGYRKHDPVWPEANAKGKLEQAGMDHAAHIGAELDRPPAEWLVHEREYTTQSIDTSAFEADNANGWYDAANRALHLVVPTQSPQEVLDSTGEMLAKAAVKIDKLFLHPCSTVGFGSKIHSNFPFYGIVAALYGDGRPVRLANDRYEHFQTSLKRHAFRMRYRIAVDRKSGLLQSFQGSFEANGGGRCNLTPAVLKAAAAEAQSIYYFPKSDLAAVAIASHAIDAGSARGFGGLQSMAATDMAMDAIAAELGLDPIEFRLRNVLQGGMKNAQGAIPTDAMRAGEVLEKARVHPLWMRRAERKKEYEATRPGWRYGVGFGCAQKSFGTGAQSAFARVEIAPDGRIALWHVGAEIGTGMSTSQAVVCARRLGRPADAAHFSVTDWTDLSMVSSGDAHVLNEADGDRAAANPRWTPLYCSPSDASNSAYYYSHATDAAARLIFEHGLWPAALALWGGGRASRPSLRSEDARWVDGKLSCAGMRPLALAELAKKAHAQGGVTGTVVHVFNRWQWAESEWDIAGQRVRAPIDGLALRYGAGAPAAKKAMMKTPNGFHLLERRAVEYPPAQRNNPIVTRYSAIGTLVEVAVEIASGKVELLAHHSIMECGVPIVPQLVSGQLQGGLAMGIGHALHEYLPLYEDGPGNGSWNFNRYRLPRASDVAVWTQTAEILPPLSANDAPKGIAEVVMIPIVAALVNGIAHATGHRFSELPVTPEKIRGVLA